MVTHTYSLCDVAIRVDCSDEHQGASLRALWRRLFALVEPWTPGAAPPAHLRFGAPGCRIERPARAEELYTSPSIRVAKTADGFFLQCGQSALQLHVPEGRGLGVLDPGFWSAPLQDQREFFLLSLLMLLRNRGLFGLHANGVVRDGRGFLVVGPSGCGKTSLTLSLVTQGWNYLSDDAIALKDAGGHVEALALRRGFSCTEELVRRFPRLAESAAQEGRLADGKRLVDLDKLYPAAFVRRCVPSALLFPEVEGGPRTTIVPMSETAAMAALVPQSAGVATDAVSARAHLALLTRLARQAPSFMLMLGADVYDHPSEVAHLISQAR